MLTPAGYGTNARWNSAENAAQKKSTTQFTSTSWQLSFSQRVVVAGMQHLAQLSELFCAICADCAQHDVRRDDTTETTVTCKQDRSNTSLASDTSGNIACHEVHIMSVWWVVTCSGKLAEIISYKYVGRKSVLPQPEWSALLLQ